MVRRRVTLVVRFLSHMNISFFTRSYYKQHRLIIQMGVFYLLFSSLFFVGRAAKPILGELADLLSMTAYLWPYPLILALQNWFPQPGFFSLAIVYLIGLFLVLRLGSYLESTFPISSKPRWLVNLIPIFIWYTPLLFVQILVVFTVWIMGYPIGE